MDLYPEDFKEQLDEALEFAKYLKERGLWEDNMRIYKDENGNLVAEWNRIFISVLENKYMRDEQKISFAKRLEHLRKCPSAFIEEIVGIKLLPYQKLIVDKMSKCDFTTRYPNTNKKYYTYISLLCHFIEMKDDDYIAIASPDKVEKLNREEFGRYLENYWK